MAFFVAFSVGVVVTVEAVEAFVEVVEVVEVVTGVEVVEVVEVEVAAAVGAGDGDLLNILEYMSLSCCLTFFLL